MNFLLFKKINNYAIIVIFQWYFLIFIISLIWLWNFGFLSLLGPAPFNTIQKINTKSDNVPTKCQLLLYRDFLCLGDSAFGFSGMEIETIVR